MEAGPPVPLRGAQLRRAHLDRPAQAAMAAEIRDVLRLAPLVTMTTRRGAALSVRMSSAGRVGWVSDRRGYRYEARHPSGRPWPPIPPSMLAVWRAVVPEARPPECCLINWYGPDARMGMHVDSDEADMSQPVVSISLGDDALFRIGNAARGGPTERVWLNSGDVLTMGGPARRLHHGIDRIRPGSGDLLGSPGRLNLTLRVVS
jgi:alkylated DNA repair protein (DNA oxidative demethylase)